VSQRNGSVVGAVQVYPGDEIMLMSDKGTLVRTHVDEISLVGRNTQGVRLIQLHTNEKLVEVQRVEEEAVVEQLENKET
jgi:DNA gyrase subunit A